MILVAGPSDGDEDRFVLALMDTVPGTLARPRCRTRHRRSWSRVTCSPHWASGSWSADYHPHDAELVGLWLAAEPVRDLVVLHADLYGATIIRDLEAWTRSVGTALWLLFDPDRLTGRSAVELGDEAGEVMPWATFRDTWSARGAQAEAAEAEPADDERLALERVWQAEFRRLAALGERPSSDAYVNGFAEAATWRNVHGRSANRSPTGSASSSAASTTGPAASERCAGPMWPSVPSAGAWTSTSSASPVAHRASPHPGLRVCASRPCDGSASPTGRPASRSRPSSSGCVEILDLPLGALQGGAARLVLEGDVTRIPAELQPPLRAQLIVRREAGVTAADRLIGPETAKSPASLIKLILATQGDLEDAELVEALRTRPGRHERWLIDAGVHLTYLPMVDRPPIERADQYSLSFRERLIAGLAVSPRIGPCDCREEHPVPSAADIPDWPPVRHHAPPSDDHPWRQLWPGQRPS